MPLCRVCTEKFEDHTTNEYLTCLHRYEASLEGRVHNIKTLFSNGEFSTAKEKTREILEL